MDQLDLKLDIDMPPLFTEKKEKTSVMKKYNISREIKRSFILQEKMELIEDVIGSIPEIGSQIHLISNGRYDLFNLIHHFINMMDKPDASLLTWIFSKQYSKILIDLFDNNKLKSIQLITGLYFKNRDVEGYNYITSALEDRKQSYFAFKNHSKLTILSDGVNYITIEGSANLTNNPRTEQFVITNDKGLYDFHKSWINEIIDKQ